MSHVAERCRTTHTRARLTFSPMSFLQYAHFLVCLMIGSPVRRPHIRARIYSTTPRAIKLMKLSTKSLEVINCEIVDLHCTAYWRLPPGHCHSSVFRCLLEGVIGIVWSLSQHEELLVYITFDKRQQGDRREDNVRHKGLNDSSEAICESGIMG